MRITVGFRPLPTNRFFESRVHERSQDGTMGSGVRRCPSKIAHAGFAGMCDCNHECKRDVSAKKPRNEMLFCGKLTKTTKHKQTTLLPTRRNMGCTTSKSSCQCVLGDSEIRDSVEFSRNPDTEFKPRAPHPLLPELTATDEDESDSEECYYR